MVAWLSARLPTDLARRGRSDDHVTQSGRHVRTALVERYAACHQFCFGLR
jgi:hypothetical protein